MQNPKARVIDFIDKYTVLYQDDLSPLKTDFNLRQVSPSIRIINEYLHSINSFVGGKFSQLSSAFYEKVGAEYGKESEKGSNALFLVFLLYLVVSWLPSVNDFKITPVSNFLITLSIFLLLASPEHSYRNDWSINNFGVIFFVAIGAIIVGVLTASSDAFGYDWPIFPVLIVAVIVGGFFGWLLAYPTKIKNRLLCNHYHFIG